MAESATGGPGVGVAVGSQQCWLCKRLIEPLDDVIVIIVRFIYKELFHRCPLEKINRNNEKNKWLKRLCHCFRKTIQKSNTEAEGDQLAPSSVCYGSSLCDVLNLFLYFCPIRVSFESVRPATWRPTSTGSTDSATWWPLRSAW